MEDYVVKVTPKCGCSCPLYGKVGKGYKHGDATNDEHEALQVAEAAEEAVPVKRASRAGKREVAAE